MVDVLTSVALERLITAATLEDGILVAGVEEDYANLKNILQIIEGRLRIADEIRVIKSVWARRLKIIIHEIDDVVDGWTAAIRRSKIVGAETSPITLRRRRKASSRILKSPAALIHGPFTIKIKDIHKQLCQHLCQFLHSTVSIMSLRMEERNERFPTSSVIDYPEVRGRGMEIEEILNKLLGESILPGKSDVDIISIVGMVGIGKTTLAKLAYNHTEVKAHFDKRLWVNGDETKYLLSALLPTIIAGKKFLLVLDDVRTYDEKMWEELKECYVSPESGSKILMTTGNQNLAEKIGFRWMYNLGELSEGDCWDLFSGMAFSGKSQEEAEELKEIGMKIAERCKGLPLAAKTLGSGMGLKVDVKDWESVLLSEEWQDLLEQHLFPCMWWSYSSLPPALKLCFSYCAIFPKGYIFYASTLTKLWMAHWHLISPWQTMEMEKTARNYFEELAMSSFFQDFEKDRDGCIVSCKMHDLVHDFARFLAMNECLVMEVDTEKERIKCPFGKVLHASFTCPPRAKPVDPNWISNAKYLRTLLVMSKDNLGIATALPTILDRLPNVRALDLSNNCFIEHLPEEVGNLVHLHYLDVSNNGTLRVLPESLCSLFHLQTLRLNRCRRLRELPQGMGKLVNLRHLEIEGTNLRTFPKGVRKLTSLHTLTEFIVSWDDVDGCKLGGLKDLNSLEGSLAITGLGDVWDAGEAEKAALKNKERIRHLELSFWGEKQDLKEMKGVAEALEPHQNLESLGIHDYIDKVFPDWIASLTQLKRLQISRCIDCQHLPPLGRLPVLENLEISRMDSLRSIDLEFLGRDQDQSFPKLKQLTFSELDEWEKWQVKDQELMMPCLGLLIINGCPKLEKLPNLLFQKAPIQELRIYASPILRRGYQMGGDHWSTISHIPITEICENDKQMLVDYHSYYCKYRDYWETNQDTAKMGK